jgi:hypothetical protein
VLVPLLVQTGSLTQNELRQIAGLEKLPTGDVPVRVVQTPSVGGENMAAQP